MSRLSVFAGIALLAIGLCGCGPKHAPPSAKTATPAPELAQALFSEDGKLYFEVVNRQVNRLSDARGRQYREANELIDVIEKTYKMRTTEIVAWDGPVCTAIFLLGEMRAEEAVRVLAEHLAYHPTWGKFYSSYNEWLIWLSWSRERASTDYGRYPAVGALVKIGGPSVAHAVIEQAVSDDPETRRLAAFVLLNVMETGDLEMSKDLAIHRLQFVRGRIQPDAGGHSQRCIDRLKEAEQYIANYQPKDNPPPPSPASSSSSSPR